MNVLADRIKALRTERNVTQKAMSDYLGIAPLSYQRFEYGTSNPRLESVAAIADFFDVSIDYLVGRTDNPKVNK